MPMNPAMAPLEFDAAARMASPCAAAMLAAAIVGSRMTAARWRSFIAWASSSRAAMEFIPNEAMAIPRSSDHWAERISLSAVASSDVWPGMAL